MLEGIILWMRLNYLSLGLVLALFMVLPSCSPENGSNQPGASTPTFEYFRTDTPTPSQTPTPPGTSTPLPSPSPTPRTHAIARGDTFSGIAFQFGVSIPALQAANPGLDPNMLIVGTVVFIPPPGTPASGTPSIPSPTPVSLQVAKPVCHRSGDGGLWCIAEVTNQQSFGVESVSGSIRIAGADGQVHSQDAALILDTLRAGESFPLVAFFPAPIPDPQETDAEIRMVLPLNESAGRYPKASIENLVVVIAPGGKSAEVSGELFLDDAAAQAAGVWLGLAAYDTEGNPTGVRRVEIIQPLSGGSRIPFKGVVYAAGNPISQVRVIAEARK
jgi:LysM repeat protein